MDKLEELLKKKEKIEDKLGEIKKRLGHPHGDFMSVHDLAETEFKVYGAILEDLEKEIRNLENEGLKMKK